MAIAPLKGPCVKAPVVCVVALVSLLCAPMAFSGCEEPVVPSLPNPDLASAQEMITAHANVVRYISQQEEYLDCVEHNTRKHNRAVDLLHEVANKYNSSARRYNARQQSLHMYTELALIDM